MAANTIARKLSSLISLNTEVIGADPNAGTATLRVDGSTGATVAIAEISPTGITIEMNSAGTRRLDVPRGLTFAAIAMMLEFAAEGNLLTSF